MHLVHFVQGAFRILLLSELAEINNNNSNNKTRTFPYKFKESTLMGYNVEKFATIKYRQKLVEFILICT